MGAGSEGGALCGLGSSGPSGAIRATRYAWEEALCRHQGVVAFRRARQRGSGHDNDSERHALFAHERAVHPHREFRLRDSARWLGAHFRPWRKTLDAALAAALLVLRPLLISASFATCTFGCHHGIKVVSRRGVCHREPRTLGLRDPCEARRARRGVMSETKAMTVRLPQDRANELEAVAEVEDIPVAEAVRAAIDTYIEERRRDDAFRARLRASLERNRQILERLADS